MEHELPVYAPGLRERCAPNEIEPNESTNTGSGHRMTPVSPRKQSMDHSSRNTPDSRRASVQMKRQDSGYESHTTSPRSSISRSRPSPPSWQRGSASSANANASSRPRQRPSTRRASKSYHHPNSQAHQFRPQTAPQPLAFFHFPSPEPMDEEAIGQLAVTPLSHTEHEETATPAPPQIPQTTHYWTSDRTRRLEYAAIDAASCGFKGWVRRHLIPDCISSYGSRSHIPFDDDTGSVRRYRLELEDENAEAKSVVPQRPRSWNFWGGRQ